MITYTDKQFNIMSKKSRPKVVQRLKSAYSAAIIQTLTVILILSALPGGPAIQPWIKLNHMYMDQVFFPGFLSTIMTDFRFNPYPFPYFMDC